MKMLSLENSFLQGKFHLSATLIEQYFLKELLGKLTQMKRKEKQVQIFSSESINQRLITLPKCK